MISNAARSYGFVHVQSSMKPLARYFVSPNDELGSRSAFSQRPRVGLEIRTAVAGDSDES